MIELTGLDATYDLCPVRAQELERFIEQARGGAWDGFNVTMPHKEAVVPISTDSPARRRAAAR